MRVGNWIIVAGMAALGSGGAFFLRRHFDRPVLEVSATCWYRSTAAQKQALQEGLELAAAEADHRAGRFRLRILETQPFTLRDFPSVDLAEPLSVWVRGIFGAAVRDAEGARRILDSIWPYAEEDELVVDRLLDLGLRDVAWISTEETPRSSGSRPSRFQERAWLKNLHLVHVEHGPTVAERPREVAERVVRAHPEAVYLHAPGGGAGLLRELRAAGFRGRVFVTLVSLDEDFAEDGVEVAGCLRPAPPPEFVARFDRPQHPLVWEAFREGRRSLPTLATATSPLDAQLRWCPPEWEDEKIPPAFYRFEGGRLVAVSAP